MYDKMHYLYICHKKPDAAEVDKANWSTVQQELLTQAKLEQE